MLLWKVVPETAPRRALIRLGKSTSRITFELATPGTRLSSPVSLRKDQRSPLSARPGGFCARSHGHWDFDDAFANIPIEADVARGFNRYFVGHFAHFDKVRHLITDRHNLLAEMEWAHYHVLKEASRSSVFFRGGSELYQE
jgi:hypothetical protein